MGKKLHAFTTTKFKFETGTIWLLIGNRCVSAFVAVIAYWSEWHAMMSIDRNGDGGNEFYLGRIFKKQ